jgi:FecR protein
MNTHDDGWLAQVAQQASTLPHTPDVSAEVLRAVSAASPTSVRWQPLLVAACLGAVVTGATIAAVRLLGRDRGAVDVASGTHLAPTARETRHLDGALVVLEPRTSLVTTEDGAMLVSGAAFFRVEPRRDSQKPFVVHSAAGDVVVQGTCFSVTIEEERMKQKIQGAVAGAVMATIATVVVYEGKVLASSGGVQTAVDAGQRVTLQTGAPPRASADERDRMKQLQKVIEGLQNVDTSNIPAVKELSTEVGRLREVIDVQEETIALLEKERIEIDGEPIPFPADLPARLQQAEMEKNFRKAFADSTLGASVIDVDCAEYPCMVWGTLSGDTSKLGAALAEMPALAAYSEDGTSVYGWSNGDGKEMFAISLTANAEAPDPDVRKRLRLRFDRNKESRKPSEATAP